MPVQRGGRDAESRALVTLEPPVPERLELDTNADAAIVASYVLTRAAAHALELLGRERRDASGTVFWISGPPGTGKTHFLNYLIALNRQSGVSDGAGGRQVTCGFEISGRAERSDLYAYLADAMGEQLETRAEMLALWRGLASAEVMRVLLDEARRVGIRAVTLAIDFARVDADDTTKFFDELAAAAEAIASVKLTIIVAARRDPIARAVNLKVAAEGECEEVSVAIGRARRTAEAAALVDGAYAGIELGGFSPAGIFPLHPATARLLPTLAASAHSIPSLAVLAREAIAVGLEQHLFARQRLVYPADLLMSALVSRRLEALLGDGGRAALKAADDAAAVLQGDARQVAREVTATLALQHAGCGAAPLALAELESQLPSLSAECGDVSTRSLLTELLHQLALRSAGAIRFDGTAARFDPAGAGARELSSFNHALALARRFDPGLNAAIDADDLRTKNARLADAMAEAVEAAHHTREELAKAVAAEQQELPAEQRRAIEEFIELASEGRDALVAKSEDPARRESALAVMVAYQALAELAEAAPRLRAMLEYLRETGLRFEIQDDPARDAKARDLENECHLLAAELDRPLLTTTPRNLGALEARFQRFRWDYARIYQNAHEQTRVETRALSRLAAEVRLYSDALQRLNRIVALGPPEGEELTWRVGTLAAQIACCDYEGALRPEIQPRCPGCGLILGTRPPRVELEQLMDQLKRAVNTKLIALSQSAIGRIIREHGEEQLEGFLKILQALQTDALVRVFDDQVAQYVANLLDENLERLAGGAPQRRAGELKLKPERNR
ncbi:MAG TPA: AAA family ATPase [Candidatus Binataceae bacterium]|nr:AAA family ATPase [Candidatus Binataceae bacterium]